ncbi:hypothetical protein L9F63_003433, partial [Diploptera punctata]
MNPSALNTQGRRKQESKQSEETGYERLVLEKKKITDRLKIEVRSKTQVMIRNLWLGNSVKEAIDARRVHHQLMPNTLEYEYGMLNIKLPGNQSYHHVCCPSYVGFSQLL